MSQELYKITYTNYHTTFHKDRSPFPISQEFQNSYDGRHLFMEESADIQEITYNSNLKNLLATVSKSYTTVVIEKKDQKLSLKIFHGHRQRLRGNSWFKVSRNVQFLTFHLDKGDFYFGYLNEYQKKRKFKRNVRRNFFAADPIGSMRNMIRNFVPLDRQQSVEISDFIIKLFMKEMDGQEISSLHHSDRLAEFWLKGKGVKYPDNYRIYFKAMGLLPQLKTLRKFDMKLVDAFMFDNKLKGDVVKRALHRLNHLSVGLFQSAMKIFPTSSILQDYELVEYLLWMEHGLGDINFDTKKMSKKEVRQCLSTFRSCVVDKDIEIWSWRDHADMYTYLKNLGENIKWTSHNRDTFREEHLDWTDKCEFYRRGYYTRIYPMSMEQAFKIPIINGDDVLYPIILTESDHYVEESRIQQNCVKTYIGRPSSIIISLRKNSTISEERVTVEYQVFKKDGVVTFNRPQSLGKYNSRLDSSWDDPLKVLDEKMSSWIGDGKNFETVKIEKFLENRQKLFSDSEWQENGFLFWTYNVINKSSPHYHNLF